MSEELPLDVPLYTGAAMQMACVGVNACKNREEAQVVVKQTLARIRSYVTTQVNFVQWHNGTDVRLVVLPEYIVSGFPLGESHEEWREKACLEYGGPEYEELGSIAQDNDIYMAGNVYEVDPNFPELYFQTCFIIAPNGDVILRYRRLTSAFESTPHDVLDKYLDIYGLDGLFPVAKTEIGNLGCIASEEIMWPELFRASIMRGAEVMLHPTSEPGSPQPTDRELTRRARAIENSCYIISANTSSIDNIPIPAYTCSGMSKVVDYKSNILAEASFGGESMIAHGVIDISGLRQHRRRVGMANILSRQPTDLYALSYASAHIHHGNTLLKDGEVQEPGSRDDFRARQDAILQRLTKTGLI